METKPIFVFILDSECTTSTKEFYYKLMRAKELNFGIVITSSLNNVT